MTKNPSHRFIIESIVHHGTDKAVLCLKSDEAFVFQAGQYLELAFGDLPLRPYSIASAPTGDFTRLEIHLKDQAHGGASTYAVQNARVGEEVFGVGPMGDCVFDKTADAIVLIAGGMGITSLKAIADVAVQCGYAQPVMMIWSAKDKDDFYLREHFQMLSRTASNFAYHEIIANGLSDEMMELLNDGIRTRAQFFLSGPPAMIDTMVVALTAHGVRADQIKSDMSHVVEAALSRLKL